MRNYIILSYLVAICNPLFGQDNRRFDVTIGARSITCSQVFEPPLDDSEDIMYNVFLQHWTYINESGRTVSAGNLAAFDPILTMAKNTSCKDVKLSKNNTYVFKQQSKTCIAGKTSTLSSLSYGDLTRLNIYLGANLFDLDGIFPYINWLDYYCRNCIRGSNILEVNIDSYRPSYNNLAVGQEERLTPAANYTEDGRLTIGESKLRVNYEILIKRVR